MTFYLANRLVLSVCQLGDLDLIKRELSVNVEALSEHIIQH